MFLALSQPLYIESRDEWGWRVGMAEIGWIKSGVKKCTKFVSKKQELNTGSSLSFWEVNVETKGENQKRVRQKSENKCTLLMRYITAGPPRLKMSGPHFSYSFFSLLLFSVSVLCFVLFFFLPVFRVVSLWLCIQHIWPVALAHTHTKGKLNTWVPLLYTHLSLARIVLYSCWFIPLPALSIEDPFQVTNVMESIFTACWIGTGLWLCHLILGFNSEELCDGGNLVWIKSEPGSAEVFFFLIFE